MYRRYLLAALLVILAFSWLPACSTPPVQLHFEQGSSENYRATIDTVGSLRVRNRYQTAFETHQVFDLAQEVLSSPRAGDYQLRVTFKRIQMSTEMQGREIVRLDTGVLTEQSTVFDRALTAMLNKPILLSIGTDGLVKQVTGMSAIMVAIRQELSRGQVSDDVLNMLQEHYGEDFVRNLFESFTTSFPPAALRDNTTWRRNRTLFNPMMGKLKFGQNCRLTNPGNDPAVIEFDGAILPAQQETRAETRLPQSGMTMVLLQGQVNGSVRFDLGGGRLERLEQNVTYLYGFGGLQERLPAQKITHKTLMERQ